ncbi:MAG: hypothetical protein ACOC5T_02840 [Elusimicrobiota bacterium]
MNRQVKEAIRRDSYSDSEQYYEMLDNIDLSRRDVELLVKNKQENE